MSPRVIDNPKGYGWQIMREIRNPSDSMKGTKLKNVQFFTCLM